MNLKQLSNEDLILNTKKSVEIETLATTNVVRHFVEIVKRELHLAKGFSSMLLMAVEEFGYDTSSALRRTHAGGISTRSSDRFRKDRSINGLVPVHAFTISLFT